MRRNDGLGTAALVGILAVLALARSAPAGAQAPPPRPPEATAVAPSGATEDVLRQSKDYRSWQKFLQYARGPKLSKAHGGTYVVAWYNAAAAGAAKGGQDFPEGSVIVKENRSTPDADPSALSVIAKRGGVWYWIKATPDWKVFTRDGAPVAGEDLGACAGCHSAATRDMVFSR